MKAKYSVFIPSEAKQVAIAAHHYLEYGPLATSASTVQHGHPYDTLLTYAEDTPEIDSHMKQLGSFVGEVANAPSIHVMKETGKAVHTWEMANPFFTPVAPAGSGSAFAPGSGPVQQAQSPGAPGYSALDGLPPQTAPETQGQF